jgi:hypothetical protein
MESIYPISSLKGNRFPVVGGSYNFHLEIENPTPLLNIRRVILSLGVSKWYKDVIIDTFPASVKDSIPLSPEIDSWYPQFTLIGYNNSGYLQQI